ncbi:MAG: glycosyl hydrolase family 92 [Crocinitomicaceae bacterium]|nr:glycosyl hydrolase family 92 [Crocinitomicaceae bacterium]
MNYIVPLFVFVLFIACESHTTKTNNNGDKATVDPYSSVDPFIGTGGHGHTFPGATVPFGMVQLSPDTRLEGWDGCGGYHYTDSVIYGFSHTHLSGTGIPDYGDVLLTPFTGSPIDLANAIGRVSAPSKFGKSTENASPGYYEVTLADHNVHVELTSTDRSGMHRYINNSGAQLNVLLDLRHRDRLLDHEIDILSDRIIRGKRISQAWANEQHVYYFIEFSSPFEIAPLQTSTSTDSIADQFAQLDFGAIDTLLVKVGISAVDMVGAQRNLETENPEWNFSSVKKDAKVKWENELSKIDIEGGNEEQQTIFYTALYHSMIAPNLFSDQDGRYRGVDMQIHQDTLHPTYTVFSLWDTFRATHPLYTLIDHKRTNDFIRTFLKHYEQGGKLPMWELSANYTGCMIGYHAIPVIADAHAKHISNWNVEKAYEAMISAANTDHLGIPYHVDQGFISMGDEPESVSKLLEYCYDDWCIASMGERLNDPRINEYYSRATHYKNIYDPETGFMRGRNNGMFQFPFDPTEVNFCFTEANSWQYSMFAPQDITGLVNLHGGPEKFEKKLDELFSTTATVSGRHQVDITGLIGQYAHGNEPSHHMAYLYNYIEKPWKTAEMCSKIMEELYTTEPDGYCGNEDCGQMSAWYVLSAMGMYSVTPGTDYYVIGHPLFDKVTLNLENGNTFTIETKRNNESSYGVKSCQLNGHKYNKSFINHFDIMNGGELQFELTDQKNQPFGSKNGDFPVSSIDRNDALVSPYIVADNYSFEDSLLIEIKSVNKEVKHIADVNGDIFTYSEPFWIKTTSSIQVHSINTKGESSKPIKGSFRKRDKNMKIVELSEYANQYSGGGDQALVDGIEGGFDYRTGFWQGVQGSDYVVVVDRGNKSMIDSITIGCFQDIRSWIWFPKEIQLFTSNDNVNFKLEKSIKNNFPTSKYGNFKRSFKASLGVKARYVKIAAIYPGNCPDWHLGVGGKSWIFMDEINVH